MIRLIAAVCLLGAGAAWAQDTPVVDAPVAEAAVAAAGVPGQRVVLVPVTGEIGDATAVVVKRAIKEAEGAAALVLMIDTPGGLLDAAIDITDALRGAPCKTVAYIHGMGAISAGALISYACDEMVMVKGSNIGASTPISMGGDLPDDVNEKTKSFLRSKYRALGEENGHDPYIGEAMVDAKVELRGYVDENGKYKIVRVRNGESEGSEAVTTPAVEAVKTVHKIAEQFFGVAPPPGELHQGTPAEQYSDEAHPFASLPDGAELIDSPSELLTLTTMEAEKVGLTLATVLGMDDALMLFDLQTAERAYVEPTKAEKFYGWLTNPIISGLLLMVGLAGIYAEMKAPGFGLPGVVGVACLGLFFGAHFVLGLAEWIDLLLVIVGVALILVEIFVLPGTTAAGMAGFFCIASGIYLALTRVPVPQYSWDYSRLDTAIMTGIVTAVSMVVFVAATWRILPHTRLPRLLVQSATQDAHAGYTVQTDEEVAAHLGTRGTAVSMLRPAGRARIDGKVVDVVTRGEFIEAGRPVRVIRVDGNRHVVAEETSKAEDTEGHAA